MQAKKILFDIVKGYLVMVENKIIHRDLKLANIFINDNECKIGMMIDLR